MGSRCSASGIIQDLVTVPEVHIQPAHAAELWLHRRAAVGQSQGKKTLEKQPPSFYKYDSFQGVATRSTFSFWAIYNEDLAPVHINAATDQSPPVAEEPLAAEKCLRDGDFMR